MAEPVLHKLKKFWNRLAALWNERSSGEAARKSPAGKLFYFILLVVKRFFENRNILRASALAYTTLLAMIPLLAVAFSITTSLLREQGPDRIHDLIVAGIERIAPALNLMPVQTEAAPGPENAPPGEPGPPPEGTEYVSEKIYEYVQNVNSGTLGVTSVFILVLVAISLLSTIETTFNDIWGVSQGRSWFTRFVYYWGAITLGPVILVVLLGGEYFASIGQVLNTFPGSKLLYDASAWVFLCLIFSAFYFMMPNTRVDWRAALIGGAVGGSLWQLNNKFSGLYYSRVFTYSNIYDALWVLPIFLVSLYFSWIFVLLGAQIAYVYQNFQTFLQEEEADKVNQHGREFIALRIMTLLGLRFVRGQVPATATELAAELSVSTRLVSQVVACLIQSGLVLEASPSMGYTPARPLDRITAFDILEGLRTARGHEPYTRGEPLRDYLKERLDLIGAAERQEADRLTLQAMVAEARQLKPEEPPPEEPR